MLAPRRPITPSSNRPVGSGSARPAPPSDNRPTPEKTSGPPLPRCSGQLPGRRSARAPDQQLRSCCSGCDKKRHLQTLDLLKASPRDTLQVAIHPSRRLDHTSDLLLALGPKSDGCPAFMVQILLHRREPLDDRLDAVPEPLTGEILINHLHLRLLTLTDDPRSRKFNQRLSKSNGDGHSAPRVRYPNALNVVEVLQSLRQGVRDDEGEIGFCGPLMFAQL